MLKCWFRTGRNECNQFRPNSSLKYQSPAPETIEPKVKILTLELVQLIGAVQATLCLSDRLLSF